MDIKTNNTNNHYLTPAGSICKLLSITVERPESGMIVPESLKVTEIESYNILYALVVILAKYLKYIL